MTKPRPLAHQGRGCKLATLTRRADQQGERQEGREQTQDHERKGLPGFASGRGVVRVSVTAPAVLDPNLDPAPDFARGLGWGGWLVDDATPVERAELLAGQTSATAANNAIEAGRAGPSSPTSLGIRSRRLRAQPIAVSAAPRLTHSACNQGYFPILPIHAVFCQPGSSQSAAPASA